VTRAHRMRLFGWIVSVGGVVGAAIFYWINTRTDDPGLSDINALGYQRSLEHGMGVMMGSSGMILTDFQQWLSSPIGETVVILFVTALFAAYFFRVAWVLEEEERDATTARE